MEVQTTPIDGLLLVRPRLFEDERGSFSETWNQHAFDQAVGAPVDLFKPTKVAPSRCVARPSFSSAPHAQGKLVRVTQGKVLDVAVDLRVGSPTYGQHHAAMLTGDNRWQFYVPEGFAHGFVTLENDTVFHYLCTSLYRPESEGGLHWNDPTLGIDWGVEAPSVSPKDAAAPDFETFESPFVR